MKQHGDFCRRIRKAKSGVLVTTIPRAFRASVAMIYTDGMDLAMNLSARKSKLFGNFRTEPLGMTWNDSGQPWALIATGPHRAHPFS